ncbi:MAG: DUF4422 domain-containing protein [Hungatella sp.]|nr:DUF4422 domain-containing protein [Hungatella sp.]
MNNIKNLLVNVVTHKPFDDSILPKGYHVVKVGKADIDTTAYNWSTDCTGDNIAEENPYYCELTAQYWAWKNLPESIKFTGIIHYRRCFFDYNKSMWGVILIQKIF